MSNGLTLVSVNKAKVNLPGMCSRGHVSQCKPGQFRQIHRFTFCACCRTGLLSRQYQQLLNQPGGTVDTRAEAVDRHFPICILSGPA